MRTLILGLILAVWQVSAGRADDLTGTLKRINDTGQMNIGYRSAEPPMSFQDKSGNAVGYSIDLCQHIITAVKKKLNKPKIKVNYIPVTSETRFRSIESGKTDILCGATTKTLGRSERVGFSQLTFVTGASLLSSQGRKIEDVKALQGKRVAVVKNTTTIEALMRALKKQKIDAEVVPVSTAADGMTMLDKSKVDAFSSDQVVLIGQIIARRSGIQYFLSQKMFSFEPFALALKRGDADFKLVADKTLSYLNRSDEISAIYRKWFSRFANDPPAALQMLYRLNSTPE